MTTKLWNNNHRPERVKPALQASLHRLGLDVVDLYLVHTPFAFQPGDDQDPRHPDGAVIYDDGVTLEETWAAMEALVDEGLSRAIGLSDIERSRRTREIVDSARIKPAVVEVESHPYHPQWELHELCMTHGIVLLAFASLGHALEPRLLDDALIVSIAQRLEKTPCASAFGLGHSARHRSSHRIGHAVTHQGELRCHGPSRERDPRDHRDTSRLESDSIPLRTGENRDLPRCRPTGNGRARHFDLSSGRARMPFAIVSQVRHAVPLQAGLGARAFATGHRCLF